MLFIFNMLRTDSLILFSGQVWNLLMSALSLITLALSVSMVFNADLTHSYLLCVGKEELFRYVLDLTSLTLIVPACQPGWEEMENLRENLRKFDEMKVNLRKVEEIREEIILNEVRMRGRATINATLILAQCTTAFTGKCYLGGKEILGHNLL